MLTTEFRRLIKALGYSLAGFAAALKTQASFRLDVLLCVLLLPLALWLGQSGVERALLAGSLILLLFAEMVNSAIEAAVDRIGPEHHVLAGRAKDMGSAAVMLAVLHIVIVWALVLLDRL